ncbi:Rossmann-like alpha/beta/alpha sandwich fold protein [Cordyceps fumosorosea ARSEF 2679]|uniref:Rossmann-like alpha/beta/alpha sandwich fold protein n=1 Tax=Cordyceps fumosorosea (strain ARSEF 2679) TaxID=1081104 RepID=A0A167WHQ9_CORFA|nr:Rossmann-like alpha/beta/alpha sandwich fold protein [Cordyceps fumosorosea ARSEF 2679]OAA63805.1 Rossmann-like alpha/beta/alpha sandwich fold protein [Cordyceps fumosorosea ARSEF 2679]
MDATASDAAAQVDRDAELVYEYHRMGMTLQPADLIFCLGSLDTRVATRAAQLYLDGLAPRIVFSGGLGKLTRDRFSMSEADLFAGLARGMGVPADAILVERASTNTGENVRLTHELLQQQGAGEEMPRSLILVQKPYMERRTWATFRKQWPDEAASVAVTSPQLSWAEYPDEGNPRELVISVMVGDLLRIERYPALGFQVPQEIPPGVMEAAQRLIAAGYDKHLP